MSPQESEAVGTTTGELEVQSRKVGRSALVWLSLVVAMVSLGLSTLTVVLVWRLSSKVDGIDFQQTVDEYQNNNNLLSPDVGVIQFLKRGYTVTFDSLNYGPNGLAVTGTLGNPTQLTVSSINLKLEARPYPYDVRNKVKTDPYFFWSNEIDIGSAETTVYFLGAGKTEPFAVAIPNVKQTKDGIQIAVSFSGERYSYMP